MMIDYTDDGDEDDDDDEDDGDDDTDDDDEDDDVPLNKNLNFPQFCLHSKVPKKSQQ